MRFRCTYILLATGLLHWSIAQAAEPRVHPLAVGNVYTFPSQEYGPRQLKVLKINTAQGNTTVDVEDLTYKMTFSLPSQAFDNRPSTPTKLTPAPSNPIQQVAWSSLEASAQQEKPITPAKPKLDEDQPWPGDIFVLRNVGLTPRQVEVVRNEDGGVTQVRDRKTSEIFPIPTSTLVEMIRKCNEREQQSKPVAQQPKPTLLIQQPTAMAMVPPLLELEPKQAIVPVKNEAATKAPTPAKLSEDQPWPGDIFVLRPDGKALRPVEVVSTEEGGVTQVRDPKTQKVFPIPTSTLVDMIRMCKKPAQPSKPKPVMPKLNLEPKVATAIRAPEGRLKLTTERSTVTDTPLSLPTDNGVSLLNTSTSVPVTRPVPVPKLEPQPHAPQKRTVPMLASTLPIQQEAPTLSNGMPAPDAIAALIQNESAKPMVVPPVIPPAVKPTPPKLNIPLKRIEPVPAPKVEVAVASPAPSFIQPVSLRSPVAELLPVRIPIQVPGIRPLSRAGMTQMRQEIGPYLYDMVHALRPSLRQRAVSVVANSRYGWRPEVQQLIAKVAIEDPAPEVRTHCIAALSNLGYHEREYLTHLAAWAESGSTDDVQQAAYTAYSKLMPR